MKLFGYEIKSVKKQISRLKKALYSFFPGSLLRADPDIEDYISEGYEGNASAFGMINKLANMFARIEIKPFKGEEEIDLNPLDSYFDSNEADYTLHEFMMHWYLFALVTGESLVYYLMSKSLNGSSILEFEIMPSQYVEIKPEGDEPVGVYKLKVGDQSSSFKPENVWHTRLFLNLDYEDGINYRGLSPLKVAANKITAMNEGDILLAKTLKYGMPPGILGREDLDSLEDAVETQEILEQEWRKRYSHDENKGVPIFMNGKLFWLQLGFSNLRDLQIIENDKNGMRVLANLYGLSPELFTGEFSSYSNKMLAEKVAYTDRILPDMKLFLDGINKIIGRVFGIEYKADTSQIEALQADKLQMAQIYDIGVRNNSVTNDEFREAIGLEPTGKPEMGEEGLLNRSLTMPEAKESDKESKDYAS